MIYAQWHTYALMHAHTTHKKESRQKERKKERKDERKEKGKKEKRKKMKLWGLRLIAGYQNHVTKEMRKFSNMEKNIIF